MDYFSKKVIYNLHIMKLHMNKRIFSNHNAKYLQTLHLWSINLDIKDRTHFLWITHQLDMKSGMGNKKIFCFIYFWENFYNNLFVMRKASRLLSVFKHFCASPNPVATHFWQLWQPILIVDPAAARTCISVSRLETRSFVCI